MKKFFILFFAIFIFVFSALPVFAATLTTQEEVLKEQQKELTGFIPDGYRYYICHKWEHNDAYYIIFLKTTPTMTNEVYKENIYNDVYYHLQEGDGSNILYYRFETFEDMKGYLKTNNSKDYSYVYEKDSMDYVRINVTNDNMFYSNIDIYFTDNTLYFERTPFTESVTILVPSDEYYFAGLTASEIASGIIGEILSILPICLSILIVFLSIRKCIVFIREIVGGA